jgi:methylmalonyl-CoA carboxyltransferase large subunit
MKLETADWAHVVDSLGAIREELSRLTERVAALEAAALEAPRATAANPLKPEAEPQGDGLTDELVMAMSAAIAAFLGKKPHIRQIRLLRSSAWAEHGRITIQASHALSTHHA